MSSMSTIQDFLAQDRVAVVGVSRERKDFSRTLFQEFCKHGYDAVAVNPQLTDIDGVPCFAHLRDIKPPVDAAILMTSPRVTEEVVHECAEAGIPRVWMYRAGGEGAVSEDAVRFCESHGMTVVPGECPLMFLQASSWFHRAHGLIRKITGSYPK
jgi:predicted CoA-binding protein